MKKIDDADLVEVTGAMPATHIPEDGSGRSRVIGLPDGRDTINDDSGNTNLNQP